MTSSPWRLDAACLGTPPEMWFGLPGPSCARVRVICAECPVQAECLAEALADTEDVAGFRGGYTVKERGTLRRRSRTRTRVAVGCSVLGCDAPSRSLGMCHPHYHRARKHDLRPYPKVAPPLPLLVEETLA